MSPARQYGSCLAAAEVPQSHVQMFESCISLQLNNRHNARTDGDAHCLRVLYEPVRTEKREVPARSRSPRRPHAVAHAETARVQHDQFNLRCAVGGRRASVRACLSAARIACQLSHMCSGSVYLARLRFSDIISRAHTYTHSHSHSRSRDFLVHCSVQKTPSDRVTLVHSLQHRPSWQSARRRATGQKSNLELNYTFGVVQM